MKSALPIAATLLVTLAAPTAANAIECTGPFRACAVSVSGWCERDRDGVQRINYWDYPGNTIMFEHCVGGMFEAAGQPNPYRTGAITTGSRRKGGAVSMPRFEVHYPLTDRPGR